jgi:hypothetical protein
MDEREPEGSVTVEPGGGWHGDAERLRRAAWAISTRRIQHEAGFNISHKALAPRTGDLVLARVDVLGSHRDLQLRNGRTRRLLSDDEIVVVYGDCCMPGQFEAVVPKTLGHCHLVAAGGVSAKAVSWHAGIRREPTVISPLGYVLRPDGERANLKDFAIEPIRELAPPFPTAIAVVGTAARAGTTTAAAFLVRGMTQGGLRVGYARLTGAGAGGDTWLLTDAGAQPVLDFVDAGHASTFRVPVPELERILVTLVAHLTRAGVDAMVLELGDGVLQAQTTALLESPVFRAITGGVLFTAADAMGAVAGVRWLARRGLPLAGLSGAMTASSLQATEATTATGAPVYTREDLGRAPVGRTILAKVRKLRMISGDNDACTDGTGDDGGLAVRA